MDFLPSNPTGYMLATHRSRDGTFLKDVKFGSVEDLPRFLAEGRVFISTLELTPKKGFVPLDSTSIRNIQSALVKDPGVSLPEVTTERRNAEAPTMSQSDKRHEKRMARGQAAKPVALAMSGAGGSRSARGEYKPDWSPLVPNVERLELSSSLTDDRSHSLVSSPHVADTAASRAADAPAIRSDSGVFRSGAWSAHNLPQALFTPAPSSTNSLHSRSSVSPGAQQCNPQASGAHSLRQHGQSSYDPLNLSVSPSRDSSFDRVGLPSSSFSSLYTTPEDVSPGASYSPASSHAAVYAPTSLSSARMSASALSSSPSELGGVLHSPSTSPAATYNPLQYTPIATPPPPPPELKCRHCRATFTDQFELDTHLVTDHVDTLEYEESPSKSSKPPPLVDFDFKLRPPPAAPLAAHQLGYYRGIQGENNSCYLDAALFSMFAFSSEFDALLQPLASEPAEVSALRERLKTDVVNDLRERMFVESTKVVQCRRILHLLRFPGNDFAGEGCEERDVEELLTALFRLLRVPPYLQFVDRSRPDKPEQASWHMFQLLISDEMFGKCLTTQALVDYTLASQQLVFCALPSVLILLLPRFSTRQRSLSGVVPERQLLLSAETERAHSKKGFSPRRKGSAPGASSAPATYELFALCCITLSHYVSYARSNSGNVWYFFDSMADRMHDRNVPQVQQADLGLLDQPDKVIEMISARHELPGDLQRVTQDCSICFYRLVRQC
eukprot:TRINITY_DN10063_c0_g1_i3.p1 TRINITY_DN10063_c0_g1~~TRINITY_DN10063_c0_g1_i3.p1  ORF type:complete len:726 (+),score=188.73 TRINITY_DN10063_c0_g1_i3:70-2247(+)